MTAASKLDRSAAVALAQQLAALARPIVLEHYRKPITIDDKADASPVTIADRSCEAAMRKVIEATFPQHGIIGEEYGSDRPDAEFVWVLDPIDGTKSFITGKPLFGTLISLVQDGRPVMGAIDMPALGELWLGADDRPATLNGQVVHTRKAESLAQAMLYSTSPQMFKGADVDAFARLTDRVKYPLYGADCYAYALVAAGWADLVVEASLKPYDYCACVAVVEAAGGAASDWSGQPLTPQSDGRVVMVGDKRLLEPALEALNAST